MDNGTMQIVQTLGVPLSILFAIGLGLAKGIPKVWDWYKERVKKSDERMARNAERFGILDEKVFALAEKST